MEKKFSWVFVVLGLALAFIVITAIGEFAQPKFKEEDSKQEQTANTTEEEKKYPSAKNIYSIKKRV